MLTERYCEDNLRKDHGMTSKDLPLDGHPEPGVLTHAAAKYGLAMAAKKGDAQACQDFITLFGDEARAETVRRCLRIGISQALDKGRGRDAKLCVHLLARGGDGASGQDE